MKQFFEDVFCWTLLFSSFLVSAPDADESYLAISNTWDEEEYEEYLEGLVNDGNTIVYGKTYDSETGDFITGVNVSIVCIHENETYVREDVSNKYGYYSAVFDRTSGENCFIGDAVNIYAQKGNLYGIFEGYIDDYYIYKKNLKVNIDIPLVPEFGTVVGMLTIISAVGIFFVVRRE